MENPEKIEIEGLKTIHKLCKFGADHNMEGCTFAEIVERMFSKIEQMKSQVNTLDEMLLNQGEALAQAKAQAVPEWIETAIQPPEEGQKVIISGIYGVGIAEFSYLYKDEFVMYDMGASNPILSKDQVKFWQPLPDAPQEPAND